MLIIYGLNRLWFEQLTYIQGFFPYIHKILTQFIHSYCLKHWPEASIFSSLEVQQRTKHFWILINSAFTACETILSLLFFSLNTFNEQTVHFFFCRDDCFQFLPKIQIRFNQFNSIWSGFEPNTILILTNSGIWRHNVARAWN